LPDPDGHELVEAALAARTLDDVHRVCGRLCERFGFDHFHYGTQLPTSFVRPELVFVSGFPQAWWSRYTEAGYISVDPVVAHTLTHVTPLVWDGERERKGEITPRVRQFMDDAIDFGIRTGVTFPVHGCHGETALLSLVVGAERREALARCRRALPHAALLSAYVHEAVLRVFSEDAVPLQRVELTARERECLLWTAEGKTAWEIARILGITERTVTFHLQNVTQKLNVSNRSHAVARAVAQQLITPQFN